MSIVLTGPHADARAGMWNVSGFDSPRSLPTSVCRFCPQWYFLADPSLLSPNFPAAHSYPLLRAPSSSRPHLNRGFDAEHMDCNATCNGHMTLCLIALINIKRTTRATCAVRLKPHLCPTWPLLLKSSVPPKGSGSQHVTTLNRQTHTPRIVC
jgi:hypothetical protein